MLFEKSSLLRHVPYGASKLVFNLTVLASYSDLSWHVPSHGSTGHAQKCV